MDLFIQRTSHWFRNRYAIETPTATWSVHQKILSLLPHIELRSESGTLLATIDGIPSPLTRCTFRLSDGRIYDFRYEKIWKGVFICDGSEEKFRFYRHKKHRFSIFRDDSQIASVTKDQAGIAPRTHYDIRIDIDANILAVLCMVLAHAALQDEAESDSVISELGVLTPQAREFDASWRPNDERLS